MLLEAGFGADSQIWTDVQLSVNRDTRVCSYDRVGLGGSPKPQGRRIHTTQTEVEDLERLLDAAEIDPLYVLVGHSYGGIIARRSPTGTGTTSSESSSSIRPIRTSSTGWSSSCAGERATMPKGRKLRAAYRVQPFHEGLDVRRSSAQVRAVRSLGAVPLVVLTAGRPG